MQHICHCQTDAVERLLGSAPSYAEWPGFTDARSYKFNMFKRDVGELREEKVCSPLAIAVSTGEARMVETLLTHLNEIDIELGLQVT